ncbi:hypothetical protein TrRE_jg11379, partial [Triparma retinervis]
ANDAASKKKREALRAAQERQAQVLAWQQSMGITTMPALPPLPAPAKRGRPRQADIEQRQAQKPKRTRKIDAVPMAPPSPQTTYTPPQQQRTATSRSSGGARSSSNKTRHQQSAPHTTYVPPPLPHQVPNRSRPPVPTFYVDDSEGRSLLADSRYTSDNSIVTFPQDDDDSSVEAPEANDEDDENDEDEDDEYNFKIPKGGSEDKCRKCSSPSCGKWRALARGIELKDVIGENGNTESEWYCVQNWWDEKLSSCAAPQEHLPDESFNTRGQPLQPNTKEGEENRALPFFVNADPVLLSSKTT